MTNATETGPLRVWVLSDGQPGHYNLSRGIVAALQHNGPVEQHWLDIRLRFGLARNLLRFGLNHLQTPPSVGWLKTFYSIPALPDTPCDLVVSAGGKTSFANAWLARRYRAKNLFVGSLRRLSADLFDLVVSMEPLQPPVGNNLVLELPPSAITAQRLAEKARDFSEQLAPDPRPLWLMMIGGNGAGYRYTTHDWQQLGNLVNVLAAQHGIRWLLLGSRRTGADGERCLQAVIENEHIAATCWYGDGQAGCVERYLGAAERVFVSEDSMTMLTEAIYSQRPVISLSPRRVASTARYEAMVSRFSGHGWISRYPVDDPAVISAGLAADRRAGLSASPLEALAARLAGALQR